MNDRIEKFRFMYDYLNESNMFDTKEECEEGIEKYINLRKKEGYNTLIEREEFTINKYTFENINGKLTIEANNESKNVQ